MTDTIVYFAKVIRTLNPDRPEAEAIAIRRGKVLAVGSRAEVLEVAGPDAERVDLLSAVIVPGLADSHAHLSSLGKALTEPNLNKARSVAEVVERLSSAVQERSASDWLMGQGWDQNDWTPPQLPTRAELDAPFPSTPVLLTRVDGHAIWVNGEALRRAGVTAKTADPPGGRILRDASGEPTGVLIDNAIDLVAAEVPAPGDEQLQARMKAALDHCAKRGLTSVHDAGMDFATFRLLQQWDAIGALPLRIYAMADGQGPDAPTYLDRGTFQGRNLTMRAVKFLLDGALGSRGAALDQPYSDEPANRGLLLLEPEVLEAKARAFAERGFQVAVHAIGDRANTLTLDVLLKLEQERPGSRHRVEHAQVLKPEDVERFARSGLVASMQPTHATSDMKWAEQRLGQARVRGAYAWKSVLATGAHVALGSDFPVEDANPLRGLYAARTRQDANGKPEGGWMPSERLLAEEALAGFTREAAWASFAEGQRGKLEPGLDADLVALSVDPLDPDPRKLLTGEVILTVVGGAIIYQQAP